jgi:hypothetical protein
MAAKLTKLTHKIAIQLHLVAEGCTICSSRSRRPVRKLLDTPSYQHSPEEDDENHEKTQVRVTGNVADIWTGYLRPVHLPHLSVSMFFFRCTNPSDWGCERIGTREHVLNPITSARIRTVDSFHFRYGRVVVRAKMPAGDWLWPGKRLRVTHFAVQQVPGCIQKFPYWLLRARTANSTALYQ